MAEVVVVSPSEIDHPLDHFVYGTFEKHPTEMGLGVWWASIEEICEQFKIRGRRADQLWNGFGDVITLRIVHPNGEHIYSQRDMRRLARRCPSCRRLNCKTC